MNIKRDKKIETFFRYVSRWIIIGPIILFVSALLIHQFSGANSKTIQINNKVIRAKINAKYAPQSKPPPLKSSQKAQKIDINGSYLCQTASASAIILNKKIRAEIKEPGTLGNVLFDGDCIYMWQEGLKSGSKSCGLAQYVSLYETIGGSISLDTVLPLMNSFDTSPLPSQSKESKNNAMTEFINSCQPMTITDADAFALPPEVKFSEQTQ